ncbi:hypothetical protein WAI453_009146 [Rhynchosporium graminicola]
MSNRKGGLLALMSGQWWNAGVYDFLSRPRGERTVLIGRLLVLDLHQDPFVIWRYGLLRAMQNSAIVLYKTSNLIFSQPLTDLSVPASSKAHFFIRNRPGPGPQPKTASRTRSPTFPRTVWARILALVIFLWGNQLKSRQSNNCRSGKTTSRFLFRSPTKPTNFYLPFTVVTIKASVAFATLLQSTNDI